MPSASWAAMTARSLPTCRAVVTTTAALSRLSQYRSPVTAPAVRSSNTIVPSPPTRMRCGSRLPWLTPASCRSCTRAQSVASTSSVTCSAGTSASGVPGGGVVTRIAVSGPPIPLRTYRAAGTSARSARTKAKPTCSTCWSRVPETDSPGSRYMQAVPQLRSELSVSLIASEHGDTPAAGIEVDVHRGRTRGSTHVRR